MKAWLRSNGLSVTVISIFLLLLVGQCLTGWQSTMKREAEQERRNYPCRSI
jgi:hypothetical protein